MDHILNNVKPPNPELEKDKPYWMLRINWNFTVKSAWQNIKYKENPNKIYKWIWIKGLPFKMVFFRWRVWKFKVPVNDRARRWELNISLDVGSV